MILLFKKKWLYEIPYVILALLVVFFLYVHTPNTDYDTPSYVNFYSTRPPIYPIFIWLFHWAGKYQFQLIMWAQSIFTFFSLLYARHWLKKKLSVSDFLIFIVFIFVLTTICLHFQMWYIQSEGLSFPFFIFTFFLAMQCFQKFDLKKIFYLALWVGILMLTRVQFYYFYGIFILLVTWYAWRKVSLKLIFFGIGILLGSILFTILIDKSYHYFKNGIFESEPISGVQFVIQPLFLADSNAVNYFKNPTEAKIFQSLLYQIHKQKLNNDAALLKSLTPQYYEYAYQEYNRNYLKIQEIVYHTFAKVNTADENIITNNIARTLVLNQFKKNVYFYCWKLINFIGGIPQFLFFSLFLFALIVKIFIDRHWEPNIPQLFVSQMLIVIFLNAMLVATAEVNGPAYFCYTQFLFYCFAALIADRIFFKTP